MIVVLRGHQVKVKGFDTNFAGRLFLLVPDSLQTYLAVQRSDFEISNTAASVAPVPAGSLLHD